MAQPCRFGLHTNRMRCSVRLHPHVLPRAALLTATTAGPPVTTIAAGPTRATSPAPGIHRRFFRSFGPGLAGCAENLSTTVRVRPRRPPVLALCRAFHASSRSRDVFMLSVPALKQTLLSVVRAGLVLLPLAWRWGLFKRFPKHAGKLWQLPLLAFCLVIGLGLNQSPRTAR